MPTATLVALAVLAWLILKHPATAGADAGNYSSVVGYTPAGTPTYPSSYYNSAGVYTGGGIYEGGPGGAPGTPGQNANGDPIYPGLNAPDPAQGGGPGGFG